MIVQGWGPQRHSNGDETCRAVFLLACMTGNVGINGGGNGAREGDYAIPAVAMAAGRPYLGMHYPSDVVVGVLLGLALGATVPLPGVDGCASAARSLRGGRSVPTPGGER